MQKFIVLVSILCLWGCNPNSRGFVLPEGDVDAGKQAFVQLRCTQCHTAGDIAYTGDGESDDAIKFPLGGYVSSLKTYGELVTSVINPSHRIARAYLGEEVAIGEESRMRRYNGVMTVQQLIDIVTFLQTQYELVMPTSPYPVKTW